MAITVSALTSGGSGTDATSYTTASVTPTANRLILGWVLQNVSGAVPTPSLSGNGLTWVEVRTVGFDTTGTRYSLSLFRAMGSSPTTGAITISYGATTVGGCTYSFLEFDGVDTTGLNGAGAVVQSAQYPVSPPSSASTSGSITLAAFGSSNNMAAAGFCWEAAEQGTAGASYTKLPSTNPTNTGPSQSILTEYLLNSTAPSASWTTSAQAGGIAVEVKAGSGGGAAIQQGHWRWFGDVAAPAAGDAIAAEDATPTLTGAQTRDGILRLRLGINETSAAASSLKVVSLQYSTDQANWNAVQEITPTSGNEGWWIRYAAGASTAGNTIASLLLSDTTQSGKYHEAGTTPTETLNASAKLEVDFALRIHWPPPDTTIYLRAVWDGVPLTGATVVALTTSTAPNRTRSITKLDADGSQKTSREIRWAAWPRTYYDGTRWWFFTVQPLTPQTLRSWYWDGTGDTWTAGATVALGDDSHQSRHSFAFANVAGTPTVYAHVGQSSSTRTVVKGTISGTTLTWQTPQTFAQVSDRHRQVARDDGGFVWIAGETAATGLWVKRSTSADTLTAWQTTVNVADTNIVSGDVLALVGLASDKVLLLWRAANGTPINSCVITAGAAGSVVAASSTAATNTEDWGVCRFGGNVYLLHSDSASTGGSSAGGVWSTE